jgi:hypothetical protein
MNTQAQVNAILPVTFPCAAGGTNLIVTNPAVASFKAPVPLLLSVPSKSMVEGKPFEVLVSGSLSKPAATIAATLSIYSGYSMTLANDLQIATFAAAALEATQTTVPFFLKLTLITDSASAALKGTSEGVIEDTLFAKTAILATPPTVNFANDPVLNFLIAITIAAGANNSLKLYEFAVNF